MNTVELLSLDNKHTRNRLPNNALLDLAQRVRFMSRLVFSVIQKRDDKKMTDIIRRNQSALTDEQIFQLAQISLRDETDDLLSSLKKHLIKKYKTWIPAFYDALVNQAMSEEMTWFIYPLFREIWEKFHQDPDRVVKIFEEGSSKINLLGKRMSFNQQHEWDSPLIFTGEKIEATQELQKIRIWWMWWCPLMRAKSSAKCTLMTDFILSCVKFWTYRNYLLEQNSKVS